MGRSRGRNGGLGQASAFGRIVDARVFRRNTAKIERATEREHKRAKQWKRRATLGIGCGWVVAWAVFAVSAVWKLC